MPSAYLLVSHGSRDPRPEIAIQQLATLIKQKIPSHDLLGTATLELNTQPLHQQIQNFAKTALTLECKTLKIIPLFLLPGVHVMSDLPAEVKLAQTELHQDIIIELQPYLGSHHNLEKLLTQILTPIHAETIIVLAHGSRRPGSAQPVETIAQKLGGVAAYWSVSPSLEQKVQELVNAGYEKIGILPYFLFPGGITDAIANSIEQLKLKFPQVNLQLAAPLGMNPKIVDIIWDLATQEEQVFG
ncbi:MAG: sirohydrochlorin chelatase [Sphaerospermopsis sp. SIO1G1]|nr:sirohydrochlorin chelatase [Sphaerospermopsis sp. SIO1G1]